MAPSLLRPSAGRQPAIAKSPHDRMVKLAMDLAVLCVSYSYVELRQ